MKGLRVENLGFARPMRGAVLEDISFGLEPGRILAVLGKNGAGKTTLLSILSGRLKESAGTVSWNGQLIETMPSRTRAATVAVLPQIERLPFNYRVLDFVLMGRTPHLSALSLPGKQDEDAAFHALDELGLSHLAHEKAGEISGGEFQLVRLARCLAQEASLFLLDEPTSLLDPANSSEVASVLVRLAETGRAIVCATHDISLAGTIADEVLLLGDRKVLVHDAPKSALTTEWLQQAFGIQFKITEGPSVFDPRNSGSTRV